MRFWNRLPDKMFRVIEINYALLRNIKRKKDEVYKNQKNQKNGKNQEKDKIRSTLQMQKTMYARDLLKIEKTTIFTSFATSVKVTSVNIKTINN